LPAVSNSGSSPGPGKSTREIPPGVRLAGQDGPRLAMQKPGFTIGIEEEYLLVDRQSRDLVRGQAPASMLRACETLLQGQVTPEFLQCQIEVGTRVCANMAEARADLARLRSTVARVVDDHGLGLIAASARHLPKRNGKIMSNYR